MELAQLAKLAKLIRYYILVSTTEAQSGHLTSSLSAVELATILFFRYLRADLAEPENPGNDRFILSKGHASPLLYALYAAADKITEEELLTYRQFGSVLEGHPTHRFKYTEAATGSLGQGLSIGVGEALGCKLSIHNPQPTTYNLPRVFVLLGDGEMAEGQIWEAIQIAAFYKLNNLIAILDVNRLGQSQQTMYGHDIQSFIQRVGSFSWRTYAVPDGHDLYMLDEVYKKALDESQKSQMPAMIVARTIKGKGLGALEDRNGWHGKALVHTELEGALKDLGPVDKTLLGQIIKPTSAYQVPSTPPNLDVRELKGEQKSIFEVSYKPGETVDTRKAYGQALVKLGKLDEKIVALDGDVKNSTFAELFAKTFPGRYLEMFIAEQNMVSVAIGLSCMGLKPFVSTFACFLLRAADQIRLAHLSEVPIVFCGSHAGVSIGQDGPSQMGLEDIAVFRSLLNTVVVQPADAVAAEKLLWQLHKKGSGIRYIRTMREATPVVYSEKEEFPLGGSKAFLSKPSMDVIPGLTGNPNSRFGSTSLTILSLPKDRENDNTVSSRLRSNNKQITIVASGVTVHEALKAQKELVKEGIAVRVIDCYSIKPIDTEALKKAASESQAIVTVEDHCAVGGLGDAVLEALAEVPHPPIYKLAVAKIPRSGKPQELLDFEEISAESVVKKVKSILSTILSKS